MKWLRTFCLIAGLAMAPFAAPSFAQAQLQIAITNGTVVVSLLTNSSGLYGVAQLETTTNLSPPIVWTAGNWSSGPVLFNSPATNSQQFFRFWQEFPIFQFAIFYNLNMEMDPTPTMVVNGPVFCNQSMWIVAIGGLTFNSTVQAVGTVNLTTTDPFANGYSRSGNVAVNFLMAKQPSSGNNALNVPIAGTASTNTNPTNAEAILNLPPIALGAPNARAYNASNQVFLFNESDIIISNAAWGTNGIAFNGNNGAAVNTLATNFTVWYQDKYNVPTLQQLTNDVLIQKKAGTNWAGTNILYAGFSFLTNVVFYDWREGWNGGSGPPKLVQAVQIDIAKFNKWLTNSADQGTRCNLDNLFDKGYGIGSIYVYNSVPLTSTTLPAVRLVNGAKLPTNYPGLTVSTPQPVYILHDYNVQRQGFSPTLGSSNTTNTYPAAVLADAVTILSDNWNDAYTNRFPTGTHAATATTVNAAVFEGIVPSNPNISGNYSGGVENFLRMLEDWGLGPIPLTYNGSIVVMFPSIYATNYYQVGGDYYGPPIRNWTFDNNFTNLAGLPPLTPMVVNFVTP